MKMRVEIKSQIYETNEVHVNYKKDVSKHLSQRIPIS